MSTVLEPVVGSASHQLARERFSRKSLADIYPTEYSNRWRDRREKACIEMCLESIPAGSRVLDLPCGTGRMTRILVSRGYDVTGADVSEAMLSRARDNYREYRKQLGRQRLMYSLKSVTCSRPGLTTINSRAFRAFACFITSTIPKRVAARCELRRICSGSIVVTFLNSFALDKYSSWLKAKIRRQKHDSQLPIPFKTFAAEIASAGLKIDKKIAAHWGISSRWFLVLSRAA